MKSIVMVFVGLSLAVNSPAFARSHHKHQSSTTSQSVPVYGDWKAPYALPLGLGPNDIPFAPF